MDGRRHSRGTVAALAALGLVAVGCGRAAASKELRGTTTIAPATTATTATTAASSGRTATSTTVLVPRSTSTTGATPTTPSTTAGASSNFVGTEATITAADVPYTWRPGCPVAPAQLRMLHLSYWGFDDQPHIGTMVVNADVVTDVFKIFSTLFSEHFPINQMQPEDAYQGSDPASMDADNTSGFNCRNAVVPPGQPTSWSVHAYGEAIDVNTVQNPYVEGGTVMPAAGAAYVNRSDFRPGMAVPGGQLVAAFASVGWQWGGRWTESPDYQHFSLTGG